jgi:hypothetical protein
MRYFNTILADRSFVTGDTFTMPDITLFAGLYFAKAVDLIPSGLPALMDWHARVSQLPAIKNRTGQDLLPEDLARITHDGRGGSAACSERPSAPAARSPDALARPPLPSRGGG